MNTALPARSLTVHLGLPKAASTSLQALLSARATEIGYLGKYDAAHQDGAEPFSDPALRNAVRMAAALYDARTIDSSPARRALAAAAQRFGTERLTLSDEGLNSAGFGHRGAARGITQVLGNLATLSGLPVIPVLVLREQRAFLRSYHAQLVLGGYRLDFSEFVAFVLVRPYFWLQPVLDYTRFCGTARTVSGKVHVTAMERITADDEARNAFLSAAFSADFAGLDCPALRQRREPAEIVSRLLANRRLQGRLDRTLAEFIEGRFVKTAGLDGPLETLITRQEQAVRSWSKLAATEARNAGGADEDHAFLRLTPALSRALEDRIRGWNAGLPDLAPEVPWRDLGYLM